MRTRCGLWRRTEEKFTDPELYGPYLYLGRWMLHPGQAREMDGAALGHFGFWGHAVQVESTWFVGLYLFCFFAVSLGGYSGVLYGVSTQVELSIMEWSARVGEGG